MRIYLRPVREEDGALIVKWRNSERTRNRCFDKRPLSLESNLEFFRNMVETGKYKQYIVERVEEVSGVAPYPIATVYLKDIDLVNRRCELCIFTSDDEEWNTESQNIALQKLIDIAKNELNMHKIYSYVFVDNNDPIDLLIRVGFTKEALLHSEAINAEGEFGDVLRLAYYI